MGSQKTNGILINKDEELINNLSASLDYLAENENVRNELSISEKKRAKEFDLNHYYNRFIELFNELEN